MGLENKIFKNEIVLSQGKEKHIYCPNHIP